MLQSKSAHKLQSGQSLMSIINTTLSAEFLCWFCFKSLIKRIYWLCGFFLIFTSNFRQIFLRWNATCIRRQSYTFTTKYCTVSTSFVIDMSIKNRWNLLHNKTYKRILMVKSSESFEHGNLLFNWKMAKTAPWMILPYNATFKSTRWSFYCFESTKFVYSQLLGDVWNTSESSLKTHYQIEEFGEKERTTKSCLISFPWKTNQFKVSDLSSWSQFYSDSWNLNKKIKGEKEAVKHI